MGNWGGGSSDPPPPLAKGLAYIGAYSRGVYHAYHIVYYMQARSQPARWGGSELEWVEHQAHPPPWTLSA